MEGGYWCTADCVPVAEKGHIVKLGEAVKEGVLSSVPDAEVTILRVSEILTAEEQKYYKVDPVLEPYELATPEIFGAYDGYIIGYPTRFGTIPAQMMSLLHNTSKQWITGSMVGKLGAAFTSSATQHGGQETSIQNIVSWFTHMGTIFHPLGYTNEALQEEENVVGGSPWGAAAVAGRWANLGPNEKELSIAKTQGANFAATLQALLVGRAALAK